MVDACVLKDEESFFRLGFALFFVNSVFLILH